MLFLLLQIWKHQKIFTQKSTAVFTHISSDVYCLASEIELRDFVFALLSIPVLINTLFDNKIVYTSQNTTVND
jgi:hypothetical protein